MRSDVRLEPFDPSDIDPLLGWIDSADALLLWAGPDQFAWPLDRAQLEAYAATADPVRRLIFTARIPGAEGAVGHGELAIDTEHRAGRIGRVLVAPHARGMGVATAMMRRLRDLAFDERRLHRLALSVYEFNAAAIACYERVGFVREGVLRDVARGQAGHWNAIAMGMLETDDRP